MNTSFRLLDDFSIYMEAVQAKSELTIKNYRGDLVKFFRFLMQDYKIVDASTIFNEIDLSTIDEDFINRIREDDILAYMVYLNRNKISVNTRCRNLAAIKAFFKYLHSKKHIIRTNPAVNIEAPRKAKKLPTYLSKEESQQLINTALESPVTSNVRDYCIITFFLNTGIRLAELCNINTNDITGNQLRVFGKGRKERVIYLNKLTLSALEDWLTERQALKIKPDHKDALFISKQGRRLSREMVQKIVKRVLLESGINVDKYSVHKLRHTCATLLYKHGNVDILSLQHLLGHANVATTQIYTHVDDTMLQNIADLDILSDNQDPH